LGLDGKPSEAAKAGVPLTVYSKVLKDVLKQLVSAMLSAVLKQRVSSIFPLFLG
jgi:hypothetical protein